jgi:hypothetical protein
LDEAWRQETGGRRKQTAPTRVPVMAVVRAPFVTAALLAGQLLVAGEARAHASQRADVVPSSAGTYYKYDDDDLAALRIAGTWLRITPGEIRDLDAVMFRLVRRYRLPPTLAAKLFAYILTAQSDAAALGRRLHGEHAGSLRPVTARVLCLFFRPECPVLTRDLPDDAYSTRLAAVIMVKVRQRIDAENERTTPYLRKRGDEYWWAERPTTAYAGSWTPWMIDSPRRFRAAPPPVHGSPEDAMEVAAVRQAVERRSPEQQRAVLYWAGGPGTETPAGIWLGIANDYLAAASVPLDRMIVVRSVLAMAMADAFIACWDTKFTYWTKRPVMRDPAIEPSIPTPNFPSYTSGHATVSAAAATVLAHYLPAERARWIRMAGEARDSRLWSGIHFPVDNDRGFAMGTAIAAYVIERRSGLDASGKAGTTSRSD